MSSNKKIFIGMLLGILTGLLASELKADLPNFLVESLTVLAKVGAGWFLKALVLPIGPLIFASLALSVSELGSLHELKKISGLTLLWFVGTTAVSVALGLLAATQFNFSVSLAALQAHKSEVVIAAAKNDFATVLLDLIPNNFLGPFVDGQSMQIIFLALFVGAILSTIPQSAGPVKVALNALHDLAKAWLKIVIQLSPYGVFFIMHKAIATMGVSVLLPLLKFAIVTIICMLVICLGLYILILKFFSNESLLYFFKAIRPVMFFAASTASSNATLPLALSVAENQLKLPKKIISFVLPLGSTMNMNGTSVVQAFTVVFIAQAYGVSFSWMDYLTIVATATMASIGTAGVPGVGMIMLSLVLQQVGLPVEAIGLVLGVDRILDMARTAINVLGDLVVACAVTSACDDLKSGLPQS